MDNMDIVDNLPSSSRPRTRTHTPSGHAHDPTASRAPSVRASAAASPAPAFVLDPSLASIPPTPFQSTTPAPSQTPAAAPTPTPPGSDDAPERPLPQVSFYSIEYPGYVRGAPESVAEAVRTLGGQERVDRVFKQRVGGVGGGGGGAGGGGVGPGINAAAAGGAGGGAGVETNANTNAANTRLLELRWDPDDPFVHPVPGEVGQANNLVLRVVKRRRKRRVGADTDADMSEELDAQGTPYVGEFKAEVVGVMSKTARFRSMADFQFLPDPQDPVVKLRRAMDAMDVDLLCEYRIPPEPADGGTVGVASAASAPAFTPTLTTAPAGMDVDINLDPLLREISSPSVPAAPPATDSATPGTSVPTPPSATLASGGSAIRLFPPPLFSRQAIPQGYNFKANPASMISTTVDETTGEERKRMINRMRWRGYGPASITYADNYVPERPPAIVEGGRDQVSQVILKKLQQAFEERPVWTRMSLFNQFAPGETRDIINSKILLPLCCYVFQDGPWRDTLIRFSYDPRKDPESRYYQRLYFRNANHPISRPSVTSRRQDRVHVTDQLRMQEKDAERRRSHIFDGKTITKETAAFQLCDITDPMLKSMIEDPEALRETCNERDGWYTTQGFEQIKTVLRHKFFSLLEGHIVTDEECQTLLETTEGSVKASLAQRNGRLRAGKHNMAKGAIRPEDAAAVRLRATLDRNIKSFQSQRS